jgi:hypothetical protein
MGVTTMKYGVSISFCLQLAVYGNTVGEQLWTLSDNYEILKTHKISYTGPLCIPDLE